MKTPLIVMLVIASLLLSACGKDASDRSGPEIRDIKTSGDVLVISDCLATSVSISATVSDPSGVESVLFWYRVADQPFASASMKLQDNRYQVSIEGLEFLGKTYGTMEFYIQAKDGAGNSSQSPVDQSVQFLPCVNN